MRFLLALFVVLLAPIAPARADVVEAAFDNAFALFESVYPQLAPTEFGLDTAAYRDALTLRRFTSPHWGRALALEVSQGGSEAPCARFAAYVPLPPGENTAKLVICPQFVEGGTLSLRTLTVLHELVHVVAGANECRAMAFAARIEQLATGAWTPVNNYWQANSCDSSGFSLP